MGRDFNSNILFSKREFIFYTDANFGIGAVVSQKQERIEKNYRLF